MKQWITTCSPRCRN